MSVEKELVAFWHRVLHAFHFGAVGGLLYLVFVGMFVFYVVSPTWLLPVNALGYGIFAPSSSWNATIPRYPTLHSSSTALVQDIQNQVSAYGATYDTTDRAVPVYTADPSTPTVSVQPWDCDGTGIDPDLAAQWQAVPIPFYAQPDGTRQAMVIFQPSTQTMWELSQVQNVGGQWQACYGGKIVGTGSNPGAFANPYGLTDTGLAVMGGQISITEMQQGFIGHAIGLHLPNAAVSRSWPAMRSEGNGASAVPQGLRLQLDPSVNINALGLSAAGKAVARAAQTYGFVVWDGGNAVSVSGESPRSYTGRGLPNPYGGSMAGALSGFPWDKLRALPANYGQFGPPPPTVNSFSTPATSVSVGQQVSLAWQAVDMDECAIPGVASHLAASGTTRSNDLRSGTNYSLICYGPGGSTNRQLSIGITDMPENAAIPNLTTITITAPVSGDTLVIPELATAEAAETVHKVVYYERGNWLGSSTVPPFSLDATKLNDGPHILGVQIYYRDGHREDRTVKLTVKNKGEVLALPTAVPSGQDKAFIKPLLNGVGMLGAFGAMGMAAWYGWRKNHYV